MTSRETRLARLLTLRVKQHDAAVTAVRSARVHLMETERSIAQAHQAAGDAHDNMQAMLRRGEQQGWMMACADVEFVKLTVAQATAQREHAMKMVAAAAVQEAEARCECKQMEVMLESVRADQAVADARAEQRQLDEMARHLRETSSKHRF